ncbi:MAG: rod shape-determining protein MreD [Blastocatellia bacterium]
MTVKIAVSLVLAAIIQTTVGQLLPATPGQWFGHIDWLLLIVVYVGLQRAPVQVLVTGTAAGIVLNGFSWGRGFGVAGLGYILAGYVVDRIVAWIVADSPLVRFLAVAAGSFVSTIVRLLFFRLLQIELPILIGGRNIGATIVFSLFANLIASVPAYLILDWVFQKNSMLRTRRMEARRIRPRL